MNIIEALQNPHLFAPHFKGSTWKPALAALASLFGLKLDAEALKFYRKHTGRTTPPTKPAREAWLICGRRSGKSRIAAVIAVYLACFHDWRKHLAPGERAVVMCLATDRSQALIVLGYIAALIDETPALAQLVESRTADSIDLGRVSIEVHTSSYRSVRGRTVVAAICDEISFWRSDDSANPDHEVLNALRPARATVPGSMIVGISSPYARRGVLWDAYRKHYGKDGDPVLVWHSDTRSMNPNVPQETIDEALAEDESKAKAEWLAEFRQDIESYISREAVDAAVVLGRFELPALESVAYRAFVDPAGGSGGDSFTLAIAHSEKHGDLLIEVLDVVREWRPPFSPETVIFEATALLRAYRVREVTGDRFAGEFARQPFRRAGIEYRISEKNKSDIYRDFLPLLNSGRCELLEHKRLVAQLCSLERRTARGGRDSIDHPPNSHDDVVNSCAGVLIAASAAGRGRAGFGWVSAEKREEMRVRREYVPLTEFEENQTREMAAMVRAFGPQIINRWRR